MIGVVFVCLRQLTTKSTNSLSYQGGIQAPDLQMKIRRTSPATTLTFFSSQTVACTVLLMNFPIAVGLALVLPQDLSHSFIPSQVGYTTVQVVFFLRCSVWNSQSPQSASPVVLCLRIWSR